MKILPFVWIFAFLSTMPYAGAETTPENRVTVELISEVQSIQPGQPF